MIKTIIIEDEPNALKSLILGIDRYVPQIQIMGDAANVKDAKIIIEKEKPELVLLDIKLRESDAFQLLDSLNDISFEVIFVTAFGEYKERAFDYFALHYLQKPIDFEKLNKLLNAYIKRKIKRFTAEKYTHLRKVLHSNFKTISIPSRNGYDLVDVIDIVWCEADGNYTRVYLKNDHVLVASKSLKHYEQMLHGLGFYRVHRSFLVNLSYVQSVKEHTIVLKNGQKLEVSVRNKKGLDQLMKLLS